MIKLLIVEDSRVVSQYLEYIFNKDPNIEVIGNVSNGKAAVDFIATQKPDIITMDIDMPIMNGLEATRIIMSTSPLPIIIVTASRNHKEVDITMEALSAGALSIIDKPNGIGHPNESEKISKMVSMVKILSEVKVVSHKLKYKTNTHTSHVADKTVKTNETFLDKKIVAIGISSGGPQVLERILSRISSNFPMPIVIVQHITEGFIDGLVRWLSRLIKIPVKITEQNENLEPGTVYFACDNYQTTVKNYKIDLIETPHQPGKICPSVEYLFNSLLLNHASETIAMLLTGMGKDGANELKKLKNAGAITIVQDKASALIYGMPGEAAKLKAADYILNPEEIANMLFQIETKNTELIMSKV